MRGRRKFCSFLGPELESYLALRWNLGYRPPRSCALQFDHFLTFRDVTSIAGIDEELIASWMHVLPERAPATKNQLLAFARGLFRQLKRRGLTRDNPAERVPYEKEGPRRKPYVYSLHEISRLVEEAGKLKVTRPWHLLGWSLETLLVLVYACGLRLGEAVKLRIADVDFGQKLLTLRDTKFHKERIVPFSAEVGERLKAYLAVRRARRPHDGSEEPFFWWDGNRNPGSLVQKHFQRIRARCGLSKARGPGPRLHDLRHAFASHRLYKWYQEGKDPLNRLPWLTTYMGHVNVEKTQVYLTVQEVLLREGERRFQAGFEGLAEKALGRARRKRA